VKKAGIILQGLPGREQVAATAPEADKRNGRMNAAAIEHRTNGKGKRARSSH
jgi:hypothetical protein